MDSFDIPLRPLLVFMVVLARVGGVVTFAPFWSHRAANARVRAALAIVITFALAPVVAQRVPTPPTNLLALAVVLAGELLMGFALGFAGRLIFSALEIAAATVNYQMGLSLAGAIDPATAARTTALGTAAQMLGLVLMLGADGHHWFLIAAVRSYAQVAPGDFQVTQALAEFFLRLSADALAVGVALAAPMIVVMLGVEFLLAVVGRAAPQLQVMILSFPIKIAVGLWLLGASLFFLPGAIRSTLSAMQGALSRAVALM